MTGKVHYYNRPLRELFAWARTPKGEVGIEIEVERGPWPEGAPAANWITHADNSLRNNGIEFVVRQPLNRDRVLASLQELKKTLEDFGSRFDFSYRTSVHVHINVQQMTLRQWCTFVALFTTMEEILVDVVGPKRAGNKFCLRMKDADEPLQMIRRGLRNSNFGDILHDDIKYASMNILATRTHGTLEFRAMEGNIDPAFIDDWVQVLCAIKDAAMAMETPQDIMARVSALGPHQWVRELLPANNSITEKALRYDNLSGSVYEGMRMAQDVCFAVPWVKDDPMAVGPASDEPPKSVYAEAFGFDNLANPAAPAVAERDIWREIRIPEPMANLDAWGFVRAIHEDIPAAPAAPRPIRRRVGARVQPPRNPFANQD